VFLVFLVLPAISATWAPGVARALPDAALDGAIEGYVEAWKGFYPSRALRLGFFDAVERFEDRSAAAVAAWIELNHEALASLEALSDLSLDDHIDRRLLLARIRGELDRWRNDRPHETSPGMYAGLIEGAVAPVLDSPLWSAAEKERLLAARLRGMQRLAGSARASLRDGRPDETRRAIERLEANAAHLDDELARIAAGWAGAAVTDASREVASLAAHLRDTVLPHVTLPDEPILGREAYARRLAIYTDGDLTPERLEEQAWSEIQASREALAELAAVYWREVDPATPVPGDFATLVGRAFSDLEANRPEKEQEYLLELRRYGEEVEDFVREHEIATVPERQTLSIELAPESAGPMARIGYVESAPAFHPNPWTTWYLATIPDSHPEPERVDFWSSFNYSFKRFIVIHELFPGHYMQLKILRENPHVARILFPYRPFIEGWATFTERIVLDAGYAEGDLLTRLAQLRKRLENANRAYTSVQAHCNGWSKERVRAFSVETSLLAPQFAASLWGRLMRSPMQIITYMLGGLELRALYDAERERQGEAFDTRDFMDTILRTGPVPSDELAAVLAAVLAAERP
jgi:uncharacterized protein (DUF885 family)